MKIRIALFMLALSVTLQAQQLTGRVVDADGRPIEFANVALYALPDSAVIAGTITDADGRFALPNSAEADRVLRVTMLGYESQTVGQPAGTLSAIVLHPSAQQLDGITVTARRITPTPQGYTVNLLNEPITTGRQTDRRTVAVSSRHHAREWHIESVRTSDRRHLPRRCQDC